MSGVVAPTIEGIPFDAAIVDLYLGDDNAYPVVEILSERGIPVVITTGDEIDLGDRALSEQAGPVKCSFSCELSIWKCANDQGSSRTHLLNAQDWSVTETREAKSVSRSSRHLPFSSSPSP